MKRNTNSRHITKIKQNVWFKSLRRREKIKNRVTENNFYNEEEVNVLFPNLNSPDRNIKVTCSDKEKNIYSVHIPAGMYENDILNELKEYEKVPINGWRRGSVQMTLIDFRYGQRIRESLVHSKYVHAGKEEAVKIDPSLKDLLNSAFNLQKENGCKFNIIFYEKESDYNKNVNDFMMSEHELQKNQEKSKSENDNTTESKENSK